jgi:hypothetical protein
MSVEIGRTAKLNQLREEAVVNLEGLLADRLEEVAILQQQLALLSKHHVQETDMVDPYGDTGKYTGQVNNDGKPHGKGTMKYNDGRVYVGKKRRGAPQKRGVGKIKKVFLLACFLSFVSAILRY